MDLQGDRTEITIRLLQNGRYVWTISNNIRTDQAEGSIDFLQNLDAKLRDKFPDHVQRSTGRVSNIEEE